MYWPLTQPSSLPPLDFCLAIQVRKGLLFSFSIHLIAYKQNILNQPKRVAQMNYSKTKGALLAIFLLSVLTSDAQRTDTTAHYENTKELYKEYMHNRSTNLTVGWVLVGSGVALAGTWYLTNSANGWNGSTKGEGLFEAGIVTAALSTPFFIMAGANKRKAQLALKGKRLTSAVLLQRTYYSAVSLVINLW